jgi:hypothetical protein
VPGTSRLFRTRTAFLAVAVFSGFILLPAAGAALNPDVPLAGRVGCALITVVLTCVGLHAWRGGIEVSVSHVVVRRWVGRTVIVPWRDVERFALVPNGRGGHGWLSSWRTVASFERRDSL